MRLIKPILLVEDDNVDAMTVQRAHKDLDIANTLIHLADGEEALEYLKNPKNERPFLILLDLNMPKLNGIELLKIIKADSVLKQIPVVVLTTSKKEKDKVGSFNFGIAGYIVKPISYKDFVSAMRTIMRYWTLSESPKPGILADKITEK